MLYNVRCKSFMWVPSNTVSPCVSGKASEAYSQLKTVKATLDATRLEMAEYKEKASRILQVGDFRLLLGWPLCLGDLVVDVLNTCYECNISMQ